MATVRVRSTKNHSNFSKAFFGSPGDFADPNARHEFLQIEQKQVKKELDECLMMKRHYLHTTLKIFLKI